MTTLEKIQKLLSNRKFDINQKQQPVEIPDADRHLLAVLLSDLNFNNGAEIGVERGLFAEVLCRANPNLCLSAIDAWTPYDSYRDHTTQEEMDALYAEAQERLAKYSCEIIKGFSLQVVDDFEDESLDFVYIDANHEFTYVVNDITAWETKVKVGGIIAGHDYIKRRDPGYLMHVPYAVHGYTEAYGIKPLFVLGRKEKQSQWERRDAIRSWFYVKQEQPAMRPGWKAS